MSKTTYRILLLPGDGVGPEVVGEAQAPTSADRRSMRTASPFARRTLN
jgi:isocitrate/isopropylmalate dehydrogenase